MGTGEKIGVITKLAKNGTFCQTWEAEIVRGGLNGGSGVVGQPFDFTIEDEQLVTQIKEALDNQKEVKIFYHSEGMTFCRSNSGDHFLTKVEVVNEPSQSKGPAENGVPTALTGTLDRQKLAEEIIRQNNVMIQQNQQLLDLLKEQK